MPPLLKASQRRESFHYQGLPYDICRRRTETHGLFSLDQKLTLPVCVVLLLAVGDLPERLQPEVCDLEDEAAVDDAVGRLEVAVDAQLAPVDECHALCVS